MWTIVCQHQSSHPWSPNHIPIDVPNNNMWAQMIVRIVSIIWILKSQTMRINQNLPSPMVNLLIWMMRDNHSIKISLSYRMAIFDASWISYSVAFPIWVYDQLIIWWIWWAYFQTDAKDPNPSFSQMSSIPLFLFANKIDLCAHLCMELNLGIKYRMINRVDTIRWLPNLRPEQLYFSVVDCLSAD